MTKAPPAPAPRRELHAVEILSPETVFIFATFEDSDDFATTLLRYAISCAMYRLDLAKPIGEHPMFVYAVGMSAARREGDTGVFAVAQESAA
jgi:hypothetical protein